VDLAHRRALARPAGALWPGRDGVEPLYRWRASGVWDRILAALQAAAEAAGEIDWDLHYVDATIIRAHQHAAGARRDGAIGG
jgi:transposase